MAVLVLVLVLAPPMRSAGFVGVSGRKCVSINTGAGFLHFSINAAQRQKTAQDPILSPVRLPFRHTGNVYYQ
jgi:hypothetical protein